ncbi:MAG: hypothetical protein LBT60_02980 [Oscillospiraceae bacterium]|jgi:hypothetical protein|nr:hypothetical protein [Oscillospiraceae bacterium]
MRRPRDPFALESAEGFPVLEDIPATSPHPRRLEPSNRLTETKKNEENESKIAKKRGRHG